ncbi:FIG01005984 hypothetical protein [Bradyrhizobium sp.]|uniref:hypothetical protein n=1 Tax=Bradyrhizobium sp. TaxID=376 RepID=UPI0007C1CD63|nr:hypothetical protein [Bradyrhizobium sp.]CUT11449.1 FIG01005984 hypothetical protein [Bradyrhizobium sp.]
MYPFLAEVKRSNRLDTHRDYRGKLQPAELGRFRGRIVATITRNEMATAIAAVHGRGAGGHVGGDGACGQAFPVLARGGDQDRRHVQARGPSRTRVEVGEEAFDPDDAAGDAPPEIEIGRALAIARLDCLPEQIGFGPQLLIGTAQRRRAVTGASRWRFRTYEEADDEVA